MYNGGSAYVMAIALGYLIGSIPLAYWIGKFSARVDIRDAGEGNVGARNVFHVVGHRWGIIAFIGDFGKGALLSALYLNQSYWLVLTAGVALFIGHGFPIWLKFIGGKGLSTVGGFTAILTPWSTLIAGAIALPVWMSTRSFIPTLVTAIVATLVIAPLFDVPWQHLAIIVSLFVLTGLKRLIDAPRMRRLEQSSGWRRIGGVGRPS